MLDLEEISHASKTPDNRFRSTVIPMICPKCALEQPDEQELCLRCGVIFAKLHAAPAPMFRTEKTATGNWHGKVSFAKLLKKMLPDIPPEENPVVRSARILVWVGLVIWGVKFMFTPISGEAFSESYIHLVNLPFHEAGHILFSPFGRFIQVLGGTLGQLLIPLIVVISFAIKTNHFGVSVGLWWLGQNFMDCAPYIDDARAGQLMLLGGVTGSEVEGYHDWENILTRLGMMRYDHAIARIFFGCGIVIMVGSLLWGGYLLYRQKRRV